MFHCTRTNRNFGLEPLESRRMLSVTVIDTGNQSSNIAAPNIVGTTIHGVVYTADKSGTNLPELWLANGGADGPILLAQDFGSVRAVAVLSGKLVMNVAPNAGAGTRIVVTDGSVAGTVELYSTPYPSYLIRFRGTLDDKVVFQTGQISGDHDATLRSISLSGGGGVMLANPHPNGGSRVVTYTFTPSAVSVLVGWRVDDPPLNPSGSATFSGVFTPITGTPTEASFNTVVYREGSNELLADDANASDAVVLQEGVLTITGTDDADTIRIDRVADLIKVTLNAQDFYYPASETRLIRVNSSGGNDSVVFTSAIANRTIVHAGAGDDSVTGGKGRDRIYGEDGNDWIHGGLRPDILFGGNGDDILLGGRGDDQLFGGAGADTLYGHSGNDGLLGGDGIDELFGGSGINFIELE